jgi:hypothetical protein
MTPGPAPAEPVNLRLAFWTVAAVVGAVELCVELAAT